MIEQVEIHPGANLDDYAAVAHLSGAIQELRSEAAVFVPKLQGRTIWMINSTARGGGVAEMLPRLLALLRDLGVDARWAVIGTERTEFFHLTKRLHNLIHGEGDPRLTAADRRLYDTVSRELCAEVRGLIGPDDILIVHDPQPAGLGAELKKELGNLAIWRCHIGLDADLPQTRVAWDFLKPYVTAYDCAVFSAAEYIPSYESIRSSVLPPAIDPFSHKNRDLHAHKLVGILCNSGLMPEYNPVLTPPFDEAAERLTAAGRFAALDHADDIGLLFRPVVSQISRWDRLKGWRPLLDGFIRLKRELDIDGGRWEGRSRRRLELVRLVLAGPAPGSVQDDPEAQEVLEDLVRAYVALPPALQRDIALLSLPMEDRKANALMVNALQRCSTVIVQNSLREGFGLTVTEAMWKRIAVLGTTACGIRHQIRHQIDGVLIPDAEDPEAIADNLAALLDDPMARDVFGRNAQRRVHDEFLVFTQLRRWLRLLAEQVEIPPVAATG